MKGDRRRHQAALEASEANAQAGHGDSRVLQETFGDTSMSGASGSLSQIQAYVKPDIGFFKCREWPADHEMLGHR